MSVFEIWIYQWLHFVPYSRPNNAEKLLTKKIIKVSMKTILASLQQKEHTTVVFLNLKSTSTQVL